MPKNVTSADNLQSAVLQTHDNKFQIPEVSGRLSLVLVYFQTGVASAYTSTF